MILDLQKSYKDNTDISCLSFTQLPLMLTHITRVPLSYINVAMLLLTKLHGLFRFH